MIDELTPQDLAGHLQRVVEALKFVGMDGRIIPILRIEMSAQGRCLVQLQPAVFAQWWAHFMMDTDPREVRVEVLTTERDTAGLVPMHLRAYHLGHQVVAVVFVDDANAPTQANGGGEHEDLVATMLRAQADQEAARANG